MDSNYNANISTGYYDMWTSPNFMASIPYALLVATDLGTEPDNVKQGKKCLNFPNDMFFITLNNIAIDAVFCKFVHK